MNQELLSGKKRADEAAENAGSATEAITDDLLDQVTGAGNPFGSIPRVPTRPIDDELREDG